MEGLFAVLGFLGGYLLHVTWGWFGIVGALLAIAEILDVFVGWQPLPNFGRRVKLLLLATCFVLAQIMYAKGLEESLAAYERTTNGEARHLSDQQRAKIYDGLLGVQGKCSIAIRHLIGSMESDGYATEFETLFHKADWLFHDPTPLNQNRESPGLVMLREPGATTDCWYRAREAFLHAGIDFREEAVVGLGRDVELFVGQRPMP